MEKYIKIIIDSYAGYADYLWKEVLHPSWHNYFYWLVGISAFFMLLEWFRPWRKDQPIFRTDYIPFEGRDIKLGFPGVEKFPEDFVSQNLHGLKNRHHRKTPSSKEAKKLAG